MRHRRLTVSPGALQPGVFTLPDEQAHYLKTVLRAAPGQMLEVADGAGQIAEAEVVELTHKRTVLNLLSVETLPKPKGPHIVLFQALAKSDKLDSVVRQVAELGAEQVVFFTSERVQPNARLRLERLKGIAEDALRVSGQPLRIQLEGPIPFESLTEQIKEFDSFLVLAGSGRIHLNEFQSSTEQRLGLVIGPEGGLSEPEIARLTEQGAKAVSLGGFVLRTQTAGPAVVAALRLS